MSKCFVLVQSGHLVAGFTLTYQERSSGFISLADDRMQGFFLNNAGCVCWTGFSLALGNLTTAPRIQQLPSLVGKEILVRCPMGVLVL